MKHKNVMKKAFVFVLLCSILLSLFPVSVMADIKKSEEIPQDAIYLSSPEDVLALAEKCRLDSWSQGKTVVLQQDIDMSETEFVGIPTFGGTFLGQGHNIKGINLTQDGSVIGLFRYLQETAVVEQLHVQGILEPEGSKSIIGGIAGSNAGTISDCSFTGIISGYEQIGGIAGVNKVGGSIINCTSNGMIYGSHFVGGVVGENQGVIRKCKNYAQMNTKSIQNSVSIEDITLDSLVNTENASTTTDVGGIVGINTGVVRACNNFASVGYQSMGYNIGGIAGSQNGYIVSCTNHGQVQGRKEVGGIVGHMEPNIVVDFDEDTLQQLSDEMDALVNRVDALEGSVDSASTDMDELLKDMENNVSAVEDSIEELGNATDDFSDSMEEVMEAVKAYAKAAKALLDEIERIADSKETVAIENKIEELETALDELEKSLNLEEVLTNYETVSSLMSELLDLIGVEDSNGFEDLSNSIDELQTIIEGIANAKNLEEVQKHLEKANEMLEKLQTALDKLSKNSTAIKAKVKELSTALDKLSESMNIEEVKANYKKVSTLLDELESMIDMNVSTNKPILEAKMDVWDKASKELDEVLEKDGLATDYDKVVAATNNLGDALGDLSEGGKEMIDKCEDLMSDIEDKVDALMAQMDRITAITGNVENDIQFTLEDISDEDTKEDTLGKVSKCMNYGAVSGDLNIGGIAGVMSEETDLDQEDDAEYYGDESLNITGRARVVIRECENYGTISGNKQYVGGVAGYMVIGAVLDSINMGSLDALYADYVGGIVGSSNSVIRRCSSKCILAGDAYVGGIAGLGNEVSDCLAFVEIKAYTENAGAILGGAKTLPHEDEEEYILENYYCVAGTDFGGIDGIAYKGAATSKSLKKFLKLKDIPAKMKTVELRFVAEGYDDVVITVKVGDSLTLDAIPVLQTDVESEYEWEVVTAVEYEELGMGEEPTVEYLSEDYLTNILFSQTYQASFDLKDTVIQSEEKVNNKLAQILAVGTFAKDTTISLTDALSEETMVNGKTVIENWQVSISNTGVSKLHYHIPENLPVETIRLYVKDASGNWSERDYVIEGSYLVFDFAEDESGFALEKNLMVYAWQVGLVIVVVVLLLVVICRRIKRR